jgi:hypothetical protein
MRPRLEGRRRWWPADAVAAEGSAWVLAQWAGSERERLMPYTTFAVFSTIGISCVGKESCATLTRSPQSGRASMPTRRLPGFRGSAVAARLAGRRRRHDGRIELNPAPCNSGSIWNSTLFWVPDDLYRFPVARRSCGGWHLLLRFLPLWRESRPLFGWSGYESR